MGYYVIIRDNAQLGPFEDNDILEFIKAGLVLEREQAYEISQSQYVSTIGELLRRRGISPKVEHSGNIFSQLKDIGTELIVPKSIFTKEPWQKDGRLIILAIVGLSLSLLLHIASVLPPFLVFYIISLYFAMIWGLFFYYLFCTEQVKLKTTITILFATQAVTFVLFGIVGISNLFPFSDLYEDNVLVSMFACSAGIGIPEELTKLIPILFILYKSRKVLTPQTMVYYGLMSGIAFGIFEGVQYQMGSNYQIISEGGATTEAYTASFLVNVARLTALPFLHAVWCAIGSYFAGCAFVYPRYRKSLLTLTLLIPAILHGVYDSFCFTGLNLLCIPIIVIAVVLLVVYLNKHHELENTLS